MTAAVNEMTSHDTTRVRSELLRFNPPILLAPFLAVIRSHGLLVAVADRDDPRAIDAFRHEIVATSLRAAQRQVLVRLRVARVVGVSRDFDPRALLVRHILDDAVEPRQRLRSDLRLAAVEVHTVEHEARLWRIR